ncbi:recombinase family protein, partial [Klebsiella pneumoniae]
MAKETDLSLPLDLNEHQHVVTGQLVGYARVSTPDQNLDRQVARLQKAGATEIYKEKISGASRE